MVLNLVLNPTWVDILHQNGGLRRQAEPVGVEQGVLQDLNRQAHRIVPLVRRSGLPGLPVHQDPLSGEQTRARRRLMEECQTRPIWFAPNTLIHTDTYRNRLILKHCNVLVFVYSFKQAAMLTEL